MAGWEFKSFCASKEGEVRYGHLEHMWLMELHALLAYVASCLRVSVHDWKEGLKKHF